MDVWLEPRKNELVERFKQGQVVIYPTDTIYGIGCDATNDSAVRRIREIKQRDTKPFSVIAPSKEWIREHCVISKEAESYLDKLPGPYTFIVRLKSQVVSEGVSKGTVGVRIPDHWIADVVAELRVPVVTTSVNLSGQPSANTLESLKEFAADVLVFEGERENRPSTVIDLTGKPKQLR